MTDQDTYKKIVKYSDKLGGPLNFLALTFIIGAASGITAYKGIKYFAGKSKRKIEKYFDNFSESVKTFTEMEDIYIVNKDATDFQGQELHEGDQFTVESENGNEVMVEINGNENNTCVFDEKFLKSVSDYE